MTLPEDEEVETMQLLCYIVNIFSWVTANMLGIDPYFVFH